MYRTNSVSARANTATRLNARPRQLSGPQGLGLSQSFIDKFRVHLSDTDENDDDLIILDDGDGDDDDVVVTGSRLTEPHILIDASSFDLGRPLLLAPGIDVELEDHSFLRIVEYQPDRQHVAGYRLLRQNHPELFMPERDHELVQLFTTNSDLGNAEYTITTVPIATIRRNCKIMFTNQQYRCLNYRKDVMVNSEEIEKPLFFCRYMSADANIGTEEGDPNGPPLAGRIEYLCYDQADTGALVTKNGQQIDFKIRDSEVRKQWRGVSNCVLRGSHVQDRGRGRLQSRAYTFGDAFAGAGGTSQGAFDARLKLSFAFDFDHMATETYGANFIARTGTRVLQADVHDFVRTASATDDKFVVDILHLSPPCQPFCGANRQPNQEQDKTNLEAFARVPDILQICKPRIATLEEAKSLLDVDKRRYFQQLICFFIKKGYSVQWKALNLWEFGVPQTRKRTIIIASGPGERLPSFVRRTHGEGPELTALPSTGTTLDDIPRDAIHHDERARLMNPQTPYDRNRLCPTILTRPKPYHYVPEGDRRFSIREIAALQTFPHNFIFMGGKDEAHKQIGNAVPPLFAKELFRHITVELRRSDEAEEAERADAGTLARYFDMAGARSANEFVF